MTEAPAPAEAPGAQQRESGAPAILSHLRRVNGAKLGYGHRSITMLAPKCDLCQGGDNVPRDWYLACTHDPYISVRTEKWDEPAYADEMIDGEATGNKVLTGTTTKTRPVPSPNFREISVSNRVNGGQGVALARFKGFIRPSELRNTLYPNGIAECCEWSDCKWQQGLKDYREGRFCREEEARFAAWDVRRVPGDKKALEIGHDKESLEIRRDQLASVVLSG